MGAVSGGLLGVYRAPDASVPMMVIGDPPTLINIDKIVALYFPNSVYDDSIKLHMKALRFL